MIRLITLNALKASDEITEDQSRQVCQMVFRNRADEQMLFDIENAYNEFFRSLSGKS
jgi:ESCRT-I complex subunit VPS28